MSECSALSAYLEAVMLPCLCSARYFPGWERREQQSILSSQIKCFSLLGFQQVTAPNLFPLAFPSSDHGVSANQSAVIMTLSG